MNLIYDCIIIIDGKEGIVVVVVGCVSGRVGSIVVRSKVFVGCWVEEYLVVFILIVGIVERVVYVFIV